MKIIFIIPEFVVGGVERQLLGTVQELARYSDIQISIATVDISKNRILGGLKKKYPDIKLLEIPYIKIPRNRIYNVLYRKAIKLIRKYKLQKFFASLVNDYQIIVDYKNACYRNELSLYRKNNTIFVTFMHCSYLWLKKEFSKNDWEQILRTYDSVLCLTNSFRTRLIKDYPKAENKTNVIYNTVAVEDVGQKSREILCNNLIREPFICMVGRTAQDKDHITLLKAFAGIAPIYPDVSLVIVGDGSEKKNLERLAFNLGIKERVLFLGEVLNPFPIVSKAMFTVLSSLNEGFCLSIVESLCLKVPVVAADCSDGPPEILGYGRYGVLFKAGDVCSLQDALKYAILNPTELKNRCEKGYQSLIRFKPEIQANKLREIFKSLCVVK